MRVKTTCRIKGDAIKSFRLGKEMSRMDVYDITGVSPEAIKRLESGDINPTILDGGLSCL